MPLSRTSPRLLVDAHGLALLRQGCLALYGEAAAIGRAAGDSEGMPPDDCRYLSIFTGRRPARRYRTPLKSSGARVSGRAYRRHLRSAAFDADKKVKPRDF